MPKPSVKTSCLDWQPCLSAADVYAQTIRFLFPSADEKNRYFWVEARPAEAGRCVLVMRDLEGRTMDLIPSPFSARSRVMEYGGCPYTVFADQVFFVNFADQRLYHIDLNDPTVVTPLTVSVNADGSTGKYVNLTVSPDGRWLVFACEQETAGQEPVNSIGIIDLRQRTTLQEAIILVAGADFYIKPEFSPDGKELAWLEWNHPFMPWDAARLVAAPFIDGELDLSRRQQIAGADDAAVSAFAYAENGDLVYAVDFADRAPDSPENFWNLYRFRHGNYTSITRACREYPQFCIQGSSLVALAYQDGTAALVRINLNTGETREVVTPYVGFSRPVLIGADILVVGSSASREAELVLIHHDDSVEIIGIAGKAVVKAVDVSPVQTVSFPTQDGGICHGFFYPPVNSAYQASDGEKPPVRVLVHGGPTSMTQPGFTRETAFWTSQGYAVFDVNYRGSTGFGRQYRDALLNKWGILEIQDVYDGLVWLRSQNLIGEQAVVSGGSAGGYTVQRLLTFYPDLFVAGASHFGIGNLVTLQMLTHKFESHYLERLIGGTLESNRQEFDDRSPINHLDRLRSPMIIFQGSEDKVVPPENSREMARILAKKGIRHEYIEYPEEGHGFRNKNNLIDSLKREADFFRSVILGN